MCQVNQRLMTAPIGHFNLISYVWSLQLKERRYMEQMTKGQKWEEKNESEEHPPHISVLTWNF